jgi:hypothetical protein
MHSGLDENLLDQAKDRASAIGSTVIIDPDTPVAGSLIFTQDFPTPFTNTSKHPRNPFVTTICVDSYPADESAVTSGEAASANCDFVLLYAVCRFGAGDAVSGQGEAVIGANSIGNPQTFDENLFDIALGSMVSLPLGTEAVKIRYVAVNKNGFLANVVPLYRVNIFGGYGNKTISSTFTQPVPGVDLNPTDSFTFARPKYSQEVSLTWDTYNTAGANCARLEFFALTGKALLTVDISGNVIPIPRITWPEGSLFLKITNMTVAVVFGQLCARSYLVL